LYGLHDYIFAETLAASDSFHLGNDSSIHQTIFAPIDEAYADSFTTEEVLKQVQYNFLPKQIDLQNLQDNDLLETKYQLKSLNGAGQMIKFTKVGNKTFLNNQIEILSSDPGIPPLTTRY
jgi:Fasciclin domain